MRRSARASKSPSPAARASAAPARARVVSGEVRAFAGDALGAAERAEGQVLFCNARPRSDLVIAPRSISKADPFARKTVDARVFRLQRLADDVMLVHLRFPAGIRVKFKAGQHLNLILDNGERRDFSMANPPRESDGAQLHIRHVPGGAFTSYVFEKLKRGDRLKLEIPFGDFTLRDSDKPILFVAGSTGFAPIKSIIEDMFIKNIRRDMTLYWGARTRERALFRVAAQMGGAESAFQICAGASPTRPSPASATTSCTRPCWRIIRGSRASRPMSAACR